MIPSIHTATIVNHFDFLNTKNQILDSWDSRSVYILSICWSSQHPQCYSSRIGHCHLGRNQASGEVSKNFTKNRDSHHQMSGGIVWFVGHWHCFLVHTVWLSYSNWRHNFWRLHGTYVCLCSSQRSTAFCQLEGIFNWTHNWSAD